MTRHGAILLLWVAGCAFSNAKPATFEAASARAATLVDAVTPVRFEHAFAAEALVDATPLQSGLLLDFMAQEQTKRFDVERACGDLTLVDARSGAVQWTHPRKGACAHRIIVRESTLVIVESRHGSSENATVVTEIDGATGAPIASVALESVAAIAADAHGVFVLESQDHQHHVIAFDSPLSRRWSTPVTLKMPRGLALHDGILYALGDTIVVLDPASGRAVGPALSESGLHHVDEVIPHADGLVLGVSLEPGRKEVFGLARDGTVRWNLPQPKSPRVVGHGGVALASAQMLTFVDLDDGRERWSTSIDELSGDIAFVDDPEPLLLVPQRTQLSAIAAATGELRWTQPIQPGEPNERYSDRVFTGPGILVWDTWRHIVGIDFDGAIQYVFEVRSLPAAHREHRLADVKSLYQTLLGTPTSSGPFFYQGLPAATNLAWGMLAISEAIAHYNSILLSRAVAARRLAGLQMAERDASFSASSDYVLRPIVWNTGRGFLLVRKSDGAFTEVFVGPSDIYEGSFREPSVAGFHPEANTLVAWTEGFASDRWTLTTRLPVKLVQRHLIGFDTDPAAFIPAKSYAERSRVPKGSYTWPEP